MTSTSMKLTAACMLVGSIVSWQAPAIAGSDNSSNTYAGDYTGGSLPIGTFIALQYAGFAHSNAFVDTAGNNNPHPPPKIYRGVSLVFFFFHPGGATLRPSTDESR